APRAAPPRAKLMQPKREKSQTAKPSDQPTAVFRIICSRTVRSSGILERTISTSARRRPRSTVSSPNSPSSAIRLMSGSSPTPPKLRQSAQRRLAHPRTRTTRRWADAVAKSLRGVRDSIWSLAIEKHERQHIGHWMVVVLSRVPSYLFCGLAHVTESFRADPLQKPGWAFEPDATQNIRWSHLAHCGNSQPISWKSQ